MTYDKDASPKVQLIFSSNLNPFGFLIRLLTLSRWSHVDVIIHGQAVGANFWKGVIEMPLKERKAKSDSWAIYEMDVIDFDTVDNVHRTVLSQLGKKYDYLGIFGYLARSDWQDTNRWFCSELVLWAFQKQGYKLLGNGHPPHFAAPYHLTLLPELTIKELSDG